MAESGLNLFMLAKAQAEAEQAADPVASGLNALLGGVLQGVMQRREQEQNRRNLEQQQEQFRQLMQSVQGMDNKGAAGSVKKFDDPAVQHQRGFTVDKAAMLEEGYKAIQEGRTPIPQFKNTSYGDQRKQAFVQAVREGQMNKIDLLNTFPEFSKEIRELPARGTSIPSVGGTPIQPAQAGTPIPSAGGQQIQDNFVTTEIDPLTGNPIKVTNLGAKRQEAQITEDVKTTSAIKEGQRAAMNNLNLVSGALSELGNVYVNAYQEGGIGSLPKKIAGQTALWYGGEIGDKFDDTSAFEGQKTETVARMMPMLTQQGDKPGSVRLVQTVFSKLEKTLPDKNTPPRPARRMMSQTIRNMYRFARASQMLGLDNGSVKNMTEDQLDQASSKVADIAKSVELSRDEENQIDQLLTNSFRSLDSLIQSRAGQSGELQIFSIQQVSE